MFRINESEKMFRQIGNTQKSAIPKNRQYPKISDSQKSAISKMTLMTLINDSIIFYCYWLWFENSWTQNSAVYISSIYAVDKLWDNLKFRYWYGAKNIKLWVIKNKNFLKFLKSRYWISVRNILFCLWLLLIMVW